MRGAAAIAALLVVGPMCSDLTAPPGSGDKIVTVQYIGPLAGMQGTTKLVELREAPVAITPVVAITVDGEPQPRARFAFKSIAAKPIVNIETNGTDLSVKDLIGVDTLIVSLVGATIDDTTALKAQDRIVVTALPARTNVTGNKPNNAINAIGDTLILTAALENTDATKLYRGRVAWVSTNPAVATVDPVGTLPTPNEPDPKYETAVTGVANGTAQILTIVEGRDTTRTDISVTQTLDHYAFTVTTTADVATLPTISAVGDTVKIRATPLDKKGNVLSPAPTFTYVSDKPASVSIHPDLGLAVGLLAKADTVKVRVAGRETTKPDEFIAIELLQKTANIRFPLLVGGQVMMTAPNQDTTLTAIASDSRNVDIQLANDKFTWTSSVLRVAQVASDGKISARDTGTTVISASRDGKTVGFPVIVTNIPTTLTISPDPMAIRSLTESIQATPVARNIATGIVPNPAVNWTSLDPTIATVNASGLVTGIAVGAARIVGVTQVGGAVDTINVNVSNQAASIVLGLASATMASISDTLVVPITAKNGLGATLPATGVRWRSDATDVVKVSISNDGTIVALKRGEARIIAENADGSVADTVPVTVTNAPASVVLNRTNDNLTALNQTLLYNATIANARGGVIPPGSAADQSPLIWRSTDPTVATVDGGLATAVGNGSTLIIAETGSGTFATGLRADTATLTVSNNPVAVAVNPPSASITSVGATQQLTASATNNVGGPVTGLTFTWGTSDATVATVSNTGLVTATGNGTVTITATAGALSSSSTITVTNLPTFIDITLGNITLASVNDFTTLAATLKNALGATLPNTAASWTSDDPLIALVTSDGTVTAKAAGTTKIRATNPGNAAIKDSITVTVSNAAASVTLSPGTTQTLSSIGQTLNFSTTVLNQAGQPILNPSVTWDLVSGTSVSVATSGVGTGLVTALTNGTSTVRATSGSVSATVDVIVAQAISPSQSTVSAAPSSRVADGAQTSTITVQLKDANGNNYVRTPAATVVMTPSSGIPLTVTDNGGGNFTATHPAQTTAGTSTVNVTANGTSITNTAIVTFTPDAATHYAVSASNTAPVAGTPVTISAQLKDANGNNVAIAGRTISWSSSNGGSFGVSTPTNASGLATVTFTTVAATRSYSITALDNATISGTTSTPITSTPGAATKYLVSSSASSVAAGGSTTITAQLVDANNNAVGAGGEIVTWSGGAGGLFGSATSTTTGSGTATVTFTPSTVAGTAVSVTATDGSARTGTTPGNITTIPGPAALLTLTTSPDANPQSGIQFTSQPVIQLRDGSASQNAVSQANVPVTATISSGTGTLGGITTVLTNSSGVATFTNLSISGASSANTISFISSGVAPVSAGVTVVAGAAQNIVANSATSQTVTAGGAATAPSVIVRDAANNPRGGVAVTFTVTAGGGTTNPASGGTVSSDPVTGIATLASWVTGNAAGTNTVTATVAGLAGSPVTFTATGVAGLTTAAQSTVVRTGPNNIVADGNSTSTIVVTAKDVHNNPVAGKTISLDDGAGSSTISTSNSTSDANGQVTFTVTNTVGETATYTATITDGSAIVVTQTAQVTFRAGTNYLVTSTSATPAAGSTVIITAQLRDGANQNVPQSGKTVVWSKLCNAGACATDATGGNFATPTSLTDATGKATVALTVSTDAAVNMTVSATDNEALTGTSGIIDVVSAAPHHLTVSTQPNASYQAGETISTVVTVKDQFGNTVTADPSGSATETVGVALTTPNGANLGGTTSVNVNWASGTATFNTLNVDKVGNAYTLTATDGNMPTNLGDATTSAFNVTAAAPNHFTVVVQPTNAVAGVAINPAVEVEVRDAFENPILADPNGGATETITVALTSAGGAALGGTTTVNVNWATGRATFNDLTVDKVGSYTLTATDQNMPSNLTDATSSSFDISAAAPHHLTVVTQPTNTVAGVAINPAVEVEVRDLFNNPVTTDPDALDTETITVALTVANGAILGGTATVNVNWATGRASFNNLTVDKVGTYTLTATDQNMPTNLTNATSGSFDITAAALHHFDLALATPQTSGAAFGGTNTLTAKDQFGNTVTTFDASGDAVTINLVNPLTGTLLNNVLNLAGDFVNGVANLTAKGLTYTRSAAVEASIDLQASSATTTKVSNTVTVAINP